MVRGRKISQWTLTSNYSHPQALSYARLNQVDVNDETRLLPGQESCCSTWTLHPDALVCTANVLTSLNFLPVLSKEVKRDDRDII
jgi:hypothetical protein